jgi:hypothetical protein
MAIFDTFDILGDVLSKDKFNYYTFNFGRIIDKKYSIENLKVIRPIASDKYDIIVLTLETVEKFILVVTVNRSISDFKYDVSEVTKSIYSFVNDYNTDNDYVFVYNAETNNFNKSIGDLYFSLEQYDNWLKQMIDTVKRFTISI